MRSFLLILFAGSPAAAKPPPPSPPPPVEEPATAAPRAVTSKADLADAKGVRATVIGTLGRARPEGGTTDGTAILLTDGTAVFVFQGDPPESWSWMVGAKVRVQGLLWSEGVEGGWKVPTLASPETPMPADGGMPAF